MVSGQHVSGVHDDDDAAAAAVLRSQLFCAVLGLVIEKPSHGYEINQRFEARFGAFMSASRSAIYGALRALVDAGLIEKMSGRSRTGAAQGAKAGAPYRATALGARSYRLCLAERVRRDPQRVEMLGRMVSAGVHSVGAALDFIDGYQRDCVQEARELVRPAGGEMSGSRMSGLMERLLFEERRRMIDAQLSWITYARAELRAVLEASGGEAAPL